jgi:hypothetical protein
MRAPLASACPEAHRGANRISVNPQIRGNLPP